VRPARYVPDSYRAPPEAALEIIAANPWAVLVSWDRRAPLASHIPVILDRESEPGVTLLGHLRAERERPIFESEARAYWARIGHGAGLINFDSTRFAAHEILPDKARREVARR
jgi:Putative FMN-binding domain